MIKFKFLTGDVNWEMFGGKFVSRKFNNGDFDYWLVLSVINLNEYMGDNEPHDTYDVTIQCVAPAAVSEEKKQDVLEFIGMDNSEEFFNNYGEIAWVEILSECGIYASLWNASGNNLKKLLKEAHKQAELVNMLFGFYMDRYQNRIGNTGWDFVAGDIG